MSDYTPTTDDLANEIRRVDGAHSLGAGALAEALGPWLAAHDAEVFAAAEERAEYWENEYRTAEDMKAELRAALAERTGQDATAEARYPMPERDDYETQTDWVTAVVMVQGKRQGWIDHAALAEQGTEEWEYGACYQADNGRELLWFSMGNSGFAIREAAEKEVERYADAQIKLCRRRKASPWVPVDQPASTPGVETRTPNRPEGPKWAEVHPDAYPDYATDRPIRHEDWCHAVTGCSEAGHCTCDGTDRPIRSEGDER